MTGWTVSSSWQPLGGKDLPEICETFPDWPAARREGLQLSCLLGVRSVTVVDPHGVVAAEYDRITNLWTEHALHIGPCGNYLEAVDEPCDGQLYARPDDVQVRCPRCGGCCGVRAPGMRLPFEPAQLRR